jgi:hypothetical protein
MDFNRPRPVEDNVVGRAYRTGIELLPSEMHKH